MGGEWKGKRPRARRCRSHRHRDGYPCRYAAEPLESRTLLAGNDPYISEFLAINTPGLVDRFGEHSDWIEVHTPGPAAINLQGWRLSDARSDPIGWAFPSTPVAAGGYALVFA